jgi:hypothetical protein
VHRQENELSSIKANLRETQDRNLKLDKEKEDRYTKIKAELFEKCMQQLDCLRRSHNETQEQLIRRIAQLEKERDEVKADSANVEDLRRAPEERQDKCEQLMEALVELELLQAAEQAKVVALQEQVAAMQQKEISAACWKGHALALFRKAEEAARKQRERDATEVAALQKQLAQAVEAISAAKVPQLLFDYESCINQGIVRIQDIVHEMGQLFPKRTFFRRGLLFSRRSSFEGERGAMKRKVVKIDKASQDCADPCTRLSSLLEEVEVGVQTLKTAALHDVVNTASSVKQATVTNVTGELDREQATVQLLKSESLRAELERYSMYWLY